MSRDKVILILCWIVNIVLLIKLIPANKLRQGLVPFFFKQMYNMVIWTDCC